MDAAEARMTIRYLSRSAWGARTDLSRLGYDVAPTARTEIHVHHTVGADSNDSTPNRWSRDEAIAYMRRLQTVRKADLGADVPYTEVFFVLENLDVLFMEGRGLYRTGAHTKGHNTAGLGWAVAGDFRIDDPDAIRAALWAIENRLAYLRGRGFGNLGNVKNPHGWWVWGHRDSKDTSCPGGFLYAQLEHVDPVALNFRSVAIATAPPATPGGVPILGPPTATPGQAAAFALAGAHRRGAPKYTDQVIRQLVAEYWAVSELETVDPAVAFAQACKETGFFNFGGQVKPEQWNLAGIGAVPDGVTPGISWPNLHEGVRGHQRRLRLYAAGTEALHDLDIIKRPLPERIWGTGSTIETAGPTWVGTAAGDRYVASWRDQYWKPLTQTEDDDLVDFAEHYAAESIRKTIEAGVMTGSLNGDWHPDQPLTRAELAVILDRLELV